MKLAKLVALSAAKRDALEEVDLSGNRLTSLRGVPVLPRARTLNLANNALANVDGIETIAPAVESLYVDVKDPKAVTKLRALRVLMVSAPVKNLKWAKLPRLDYLGIAAPLTSLDGLAQMAALGELVVHGAKLAKPGTIKSAKLWKLIMDGCGIKTAPRLVTPALAILFLHDNPMTTLAGLEHVAELTDVIVDPRIKKIERATHERLLALPSFELRAGRVMKYPAFAAKREIV